MFDLSFPSISDIFLTTKLIILCIQTENNRVSPTPLNSFAFLYVTNRVLRTYHGYISVVSETTVILFNLTTLNDLLQTRHSYELGTQKFD